MWGIDLRPNSKAPSVASQDSTANPARPLSMSAVSNPSTQQRATSKPASSSGCLEPPPPKKRMAKQLVKTQLCKHFVRGYCRYQEKCAYAHYAEELVPKPDLQKTKMCVSFLSGTCMNLNCSYAHGVEELRLVSSSHAGSELGSASSTMEGPWFYSHGLAHEGQGRSSAPPGLFGSHALLGSLENVRFAALAEGRDDPRTAYPMRPGWQADLRAVNEHQRQLATWQRELLGESQMFVDSAASQNWGNLVTAQLREQRKKYYAQGKVLLESDRRKDPLTFLEEQMLASILLGDRYWGDAFPQLTHRCSTMLATRLFSSFQQEAPGRSSSSAPRPEAAGSAFQPDPRAALYNHQAYARPFAAPNRFDLDSAAGHPAEGGTNPKSADLLRHSHTTELSGSGGQFGNSESEAVPWSGSSTLAHRQFELLDMDTLWMSHHPSRQTSGDGAVEPVEATSCGAMLASPSPINSVSAAYPMTATAPQAWQGTVVGQTETERLNELLLRLAHSSSAAGAIQRL